MNDEMLHAFFNAIDRTLAHNFTMYTFHKNIQYFRNLDILSII